MVKRRLFQVLRFLFLGLMLVFLYAPIVLLIVYSFNNSKVIGNWKGFTLHWYVDLFRNSTIIDSLWVTVSIAVLSSVLATVLGTAGAIGIHSMRKRVRGAVESISQLPMVNPDLVTGISLMLLFMAVGLRDGYMRMLIAHITFNIPYVLFSVLPRLRRSSNMLYEAAMDLGCTPTQALWRVVIPDIWPGILSGFILAFTLSLDDFVISFFVGNGVNNLSMYIYSAARQGVNPALSTILFVPVVSLLLIVNLRSLKKEREEEVQNRKVRRKR